MLFTERNEFVYDMEMFAGADLQTALKIHREYSVKFSPQPPPQFLEVDRSQAQMDELWHTPIGPRTVFSRTLSIPSLVVAEKPDWRLTRIGLVPQQRSKFVLSNLLLQEANYFPNRGDLVVYNGYRYMIVNVALEPNGFWAQTNVWLGLVVETRIPPEGDAKPVVNPGVLAPAEVAPPRANLAQTYSVGPIPNI